MGSDITWKCLGNGKYAIRVTVYRSCNGIPIQYSPIEVKSKCGNYSHNGGGGPSGGQDITPVCEKRECTRCTNSSCRIPFGIEQYFFDDTIDVSKVNCSEFTIAWQQQARNVNIETGAAGLNFYCEASFSRRPPADKPCDNSPYFTRPPIAIYCKDRCEIYNPGVNDDDMNARGEADSLSYEFTDPLQGEGQTIPYISGFSKDAPLKFDGFPDKDGEFDPPKCKGFHLDPETGEIKFKATEETITVMAINVTEWRKDSSGKYQPIGTVRRDLQISIVDCGDNRSPVVTGIDCQKPTTMTFCANQSKCFTICSFDPDINDTVSLSWNNQVPGAKFTVEEGKKWPKAQFCWSPTNAHVRSYPWRFIVTATDDHCDINGRTSKTFTLYVRPAPEGYIKQTKDKCGWTTLQAIVTNGVAIKSYSWNGPYSPRDALVNVPNGTVKVKYKPNPNKIPTKYPITVTITSKDGCETQIVDTVTVDQYVYPDLGADTTVCVNTAMKLKVKTYFGKADYIYSWYVYNKATKTFEEKIGKVKDATEYNITANEDKIVVVKVVDGNACDNDDTLRIKAQIPPAPFLGQDIKGCEGTPVVLDARKNVAGKVMPMIRTTQWYKSDGVGGWINMPSGPTLPVKDAGTYKTILTDSIGCTGTDEVNITFYPLVDVVKKSQTVCKGDSAHVSGGIGTTNTLWEWYDLRYPLTKPPVSKTRNYDFKPAGFTNKVQVLKFLVKATEKHPEVNCMDADTITVEVHPLPVVNAGKPLAQCIDNPDYDLSTVPGLSPDNTGVWSAKSNPFAIYNGKILSPKGLGVGKHTLTYTYTDPVTKCFNTADVQIVIDTLPKVFAGKDTFRCMRDGKMTLNWGQPISGSQGKGYWYPADPNANFIVGNISQQFDPVKAGAGQHKLIYHFESGQKTKCDAEDTLVIEVFPDLKVIPGTYDPVCAGAGNTIILNATPSGGKWLGPGSQHVKSDGLGGWYFDAYEAGAGDYYPYYRVAHKPGAGDYCPDSATAHLVVNPLPSPTVTTPDNKTTYCVAGGDIQLVRNPSSSQPLIIQEQEGQDALHGSTFSPAEAGAGTYHVLYPYTDANGCKGTGTLTLQIDDTSSVQINTSGSLCEGAKYDITATIKNAAGIKWVSTDGKPLTAAQGQGTANVSYIPTPLEINAGRFNLKVTVYNPGVCDSAYTDRWFDINPSPTAKFSIPKKEGCSPLKVEFINQSDVKGEPGDIAQTNWTFYNDKDPNNPVGKVSKVGVETATFTFLEPGSYSVKMEVITKNGCPSSMNESGIIVYESPRPDFIGRPTFTTITNPKIKFENRTDASSIDENTSWEWNFGDRYVTGGGSATTRDAEWLYHDTGKYTVSLKAINGKGCDAIKTRYLYIDIRPEIIVFVPNVFTPATANRKLGPAKNNVFQPVISHVDRGEMFIYNRWGELMYYTNKLTTVTDAKDGTYNSLEGWDGKHNDEDVPMDVYVYLIKITSFSGKEHKYTGTVTLLR
jgi:hypothetical protein